MCNTPVTAAADHLTWDTNTRSGRWTDFGQTPHPFMKPVERILPPVALGEDVTLTFRNASGPDPTGWTLGVYLSDVADGPPLPLFASVVTVSDAPTRTIQVFVGGADTETLPAGTVYGEVWREDDDATYVLRRFELAVYDPVRPSAPDDEIILDGGP